MMGIDPDITEESTSTPVEEAAPPVADKNPTTATESETETASAVTTESVSGQTRSKSAAQSVSLVSKHPTYTIRDYTKLFCRKHNKTTKVRNSQPPIMYYRPRMQMPNKGRPGIFFVEGVNCQFNSGVSLLCPGRTFRLRKTKSFVVLGCIWIGAHKKGNRFSCIKPAYAILVFEHDLYNPEPVMYKGKITSIYGCKFLKMDDTVSQKLIDDASKKFANMMKLHGRTRTYWDNLTTVGEPVCKDMPKKIKAKPEPKQKAKPRTRRKQSTLTPKPEVRFAGKSSPASFAVEDLLQQLDETKSELAVVRDVVKTSKAAVTELTKNVNAVLARDREQQREQQHNNVNTSRTPKRKRRKRKRKKNKRKSRSPSPISTSQSSSTSPSGRNYD